MKKILLLFAFTAPACLIQAQRFFYLEKGNMAEIPLKRDLLKASQFVTESPLMSDYIVKTEVGFQKESNITTLKIVLEDSATFKTIFLTKEEYALGGLKLNPGIFLNLAMETLIEKNIDQIIHSAKDDHFHTQTKLIGLKKDKT